MTEQPTNSSPKTPLAAYLATNDVACAECGYNLRGGTDPFCPECGQVIPRPLSGDLAKSLNQVPRRLWCRKCGYDLTAHTSDACPECGETTLIQAGDDHEMGSWIASRILRGTAIVAALEAAFGLLALLGALQFRGLSVRKPGFALISLLFLAVVILNGTFVEWGFLRHANPRQVKLLKIMRAAFGVAALASGTMLMLLVW